MRIYEIPTDETLRSELKHGTEKFPFAFYLDEIDQFRSKCIEWHWHREVEFSLVLRGNVRCLTEGDTCVLRCGEGLFINSETIHRFESEDGGIMANMVFAPELIAPKGSLIYTEYVESILNSDCPIICFRGTVPSENNVLKHIDRLYKATESSLFSVYNAASLLWEVLSEFVETEIPHREKRESKLLRARMHKMVQFINKNYKCQVALSEIAAAANISVSEALRCFRTTIQTTPVAYLNDHRLSCSKDLLLSTSDSVTAIALATGFESPSYFCRMFKRRYGVSPNAFRKLRKE